MLNHSRVLRELQELSDKLFVDLSPAYEKAREVWERISVDPTFLAKVYAAQAQAPWLLPTWQGSLGDIHEIEQTQSRYRILAIDGSQIYPDRHQGTACFLINIGTVHLAYGLPGKAVTFDSVPSVYLNDEQDEQANTETVNCKRQELEFKVGVQESKRVKTECADDAPFLFLFDGSLIFWHLESKDMMLKETYLSHYLASLHQLHQLKVLTAGYISLPKNKELVNLIRLALCNFDFNASDKYKEVDPLVDTNIAHFYLKPYSRSTMFKSHAKICQSYPDHLHPHFFYLHVGNEIGRVEIPAWIAANEGYVTLISRMIIDQAIKGKGYPVALAEAHEQAVVKGPDREFFYQLISKLGFERNHHFVMSQKSVKKRGLNI